MSHTNSTTNYNLPQFLGTDKPAWLGDINPAMTAIDTAIKTASDNATTASTGTTANTTAIGTLSSLTTTAKTDLVSAINEVDSDVGTLNTQVGTNTNAIADNARNIINLDNGLTALTNKFILSDITTSSVSPTGTTSNTLTLAQNTEGSVFKIYGSLQGTNISWPRVAIPGATGQYGIATGLTLNTAPSEAFAIDGAILAIIQNVNNYTMVDNERPLGIYVGTDGKIYLWPWSNAGTSSTGSGVACRLWSPCCVYFNTNFGDQPTPDN